MRRLLTFAFLFVPLALEASGVGAKIPPPTCPSGNCPWSAVAAVKIPPPTCPSGNCPWSEVKAARIPPPTCPSGNCPW
jgi:hypothetical protein